VTAKPDEPKRSSAPPGRIERATALALRCGAWARRRVPGAEVLVAAFEREHLAAAGLLAGGIAYRMFLWLLPLGLVLGTVASFWVERNPGEAKNAAEDFGLGAVAAQNAIDAVSEGTHARWYLFLVGLVLMIWFSGGVVRAFRIAFAVAWGVRPERLRRAPLAGALFTGIVLALAAATVGTAWLREQLGDFGLLLTLLLLLVYFAVALWALTLLPHRDASRTALLPGAALVAVGLQAIHLAVVLYLVPKLGRSSELYGALGAATVLLLWLYLIARVLVAGAFLNAALWERRQARES
jgi:uncharacterized BrkB/YihY/UPF0761 family membrane protein